MKSKRIFSYWTIFAVFSLFILALTTKAIAEEGIFHKTVSKPVQWYEPDELIVKFKEDIPEASIERINHRHGSSHVSGNRRVGFRKLKLAKGKNVFDMAAAYSKDPNVEYARPNYNCRAFYMPNDPYYPYQWNLKLINMEQAWDIETADPSVVVAVLDTGVAYENHSEILSRRRRKSYYQAPDLDETSFVDGYDFINNDEHANDDQGHGTHITGTIAQSTNNQSGVAGIAFNCSIMPVKVLDETGSGTVYTLANGIIFAADNGAKVINTSLGFPSYVTEHDIPAVTEAVQYAYSKGCVLVASSGNEGVDIVGLPAAYPEVIAVGAVHSGDARADYSQYGSELELVAPGGDSEDRDGDGYMDGVLQQTFGNNTRDWGYWFYTGTSCSAPHVSAVSALLIASGVATTAEDVREALRATAVDKGPAGWDQEYGWGRVDAYAALQWTPGPVDNPPAVNITAPEDGAAVSGLVTITADTADDIGVARVDFYYDSTLIGTDASSPYSINWDTTNVSDSAYTINATAVDTAPQSATDSIGVIVDNTNDPPIADAGPDQTVFDADGNGSESVTLDGSGSDDPDGSISAYEWTEGSTVLGITAAITYDFTVGNHTVILTVTDDKGDSAGDEVVITVNANQPPAAEAGPDKDATVGQVVSFDGSGSSDPDGSITSYDWNFGDDSTGSGITSSHVYLTAGTYTVTLTVEDSGGLIDTDTSVVTVTEAPANLMHVESIDMEVIRSFRRWSQVRAIVLIADESGNPVPGANVVGNWSGAYNLTGVSGTTGSDGKVSFTSRRGSGTLSFTVTDVTKSGWTYDPSKNKETSG